MCFNFTRKHVYLLLEGILFVIAFFLGPMFYLFGAFESILNRDQSIYNNLITASFTMAGFTIAATAFAIRSNLNIKRLIIPTILFLASGLMMYANIIVGEFSTFNIDIAKSNLLEYAFSAYVLIEGSGIVLFFTAIVFLILELFVIYSEYQPVKHSQK